MLGTRGIVGDLSEGIYNYIDKRNSFQMCSETARRLITTSEIIGHEN